MKEVKILGVVFALRPLKSPAYLYRWFLAWKRNQIMGPGLRRYAEAARRLSDSVERFIQAMKDAGMEEERRSIKSKK